MTIRHNSFEGGTSGTTVSAANSGGVSGNAWNIVVVNSGTLTYDTTTRSGISALSLKYGTISNANDSNIRWTGLNADTLYIRFYYMTTSFVNVYTYISDYYTAAGARNALLFIDNSGQMFAYDTNTTNQGLITTLAINTWYRIEIKLIRNASAGSLSVRIYTSVESWGTPALSYATSSINTGTTATDQILIFTNSSGSSGTASVYLDDIAVATNDWIGPVTRPVPQITLS
jgi:hypothetical protein